MDGSQWLSKKYIDFKKPENISDIFWWAGEDVPKEPAERVQKYLDIFTFIRIVSRFFLIIPN